MVNIGKSQLGGVSGDALMKGIDNIVFGQHLSKVTPKKKILIKIKIKLNYIYIYN